MAVQHETELYGPIKQYFEGFGYEVKGEVRHCDLVAVAPGDGGEDDDIVIVEMKKTFNLALLLQGIERLKSTDQVYLAVERNRTKRGAVNQRWSALTGLCRRLGLGLITVTFYKTKKPFVEVLCKPENAMNGARRNKYRQSRLMLEFKERSGDYNVGGSTKRKLVTAYREKALHVAAQLREHGQLSPRRLRDLTGIGSAAAILQHNYYGWFERVSRGVYRLTPSGEQALAQYSHVVSELAAAEGSGNRQEDGGPEEVE
ncbi:DUF2161 domain-containing phosphodiesterase [Paenibacillus sp. CECT 9249]|uniref:DUF2161 domain-containing phosphodiesterase n=1 Tax=unclassified Paenibacillus TaxID=185978 RepID=UPI001C11EF88|nr:DUF2161 family putative PD-(D/E)XK-type phosphodiesterase [Paenibacillus sp. CECT 9249]MBU5442758.1 hypothetical protein [Paenibacillus sp. MSJ-34]CAH0117831.1 hypothetical protein PAE9249_00292 [Paenibacillus sp. CECT 9249]